VVDRALGVALGIRPDLLPENLMANYQRFVSKNFDARARQLGWLPHAGESDDDRLLRPPIVGAVARFGGDSELAAEAKGLADKWLNDQKAVPAEIVSSVLGTAAYYGDSALYKRFLDAFLHSQDNQVKQHLLAALSSFRDRTALEAGFQAVLDKKIPLVDGFQLLLAGGLDPRTRSLSFEFIKQHFDELTAGHPNIFGNDLGSFLPFSGGSFCDARSREEFQAFFGPRVDQYTGAPRNYAQVLESIDLCIVQRTAQEASVKAFLEKY
jgi:alanyl aminopeptidase